MCVCEADTALGSVYDTAIALVYLQCVVYVCVCHRSPVQVGVLVCVLYVCVCLCVPQVPVQVGVFVCVLYVCVCVPQVTSSSWGVCVCTVCVCVQ